MRRFDASIVEPLVAPAPTMVWISSMKRIAPGRLLRAGDDPLEPLLELAAELGAGDEPAHVEGVDARVLQHLRHPLLVDGEREPLDDGRLADARVADQHRVVLPAAAEDLDHPLDLAPGGR